MAIVVDGLRLVNSKRRLPTEAFFVDTNVVMDFKDPFSHASLDRYLQRRQEKVSNVVNYLKSIGVRTYSTLGVVQEYYKTIQVGFYQLQPGKGKFEVADFKKLKRSDSSFKDGWQLQMKQLTKTFTRNFPVHNMFPDPDETIRTFTGINVDFGDHFLFKTVMCAPKNMWCVFSNDADFYSFPDDLYLLTTNGQIIKTAEKDGKLY